MLLFLLTLADPCDREKIEYIYNNFHNDMIKLAENKFKNADFQNCHLNAEDAVQNAFVKITKYIKNIDITNKKRLKAYVLTIVSNEVYTIMNSHEIYDSIDEMENELSDDEFIENLHINEKYENAVKTIKQMDDKYSMTLFFRFCQNMSVDEIAEFMGLSKKTVYTRLERGKRLLIENLEKEDK